MSRRYGRNQKRRAREEIARLERQTSYWSERYEQDTRLLRHTVENQRYTLDKVSRVLGQNFIGLEALERHLDYLEDKYEQDFYQLVMAEHPCTMFAARVEVKEDALRDQAHVIFKLGAERSVYAVSKQALLRTPEDVLVRNMMERLCTHAIRSVRSLNKAR